MANAQAKRRGGKASPRSQMHNPRPLERPVGQPGQGEEAGVAWLLLFSFYPYHGGLSLRSETALRVTSYRNANKGLFGLANETSRIGKFDPFAHAMIHMLILTSKPELHKQFCYFL